MSIDGFISGTKGEMEWMVLDWSDDIKEYVRQITAPVDTILLGRNLAQGFIPYWTEALNRSQPEEGAEIMVNTPKIVFTRTMNNSIWENTVLAKGDLTDELSILKNKKGGDMIVYGGGKFVSSLLKLNLIDVLHLFINPVILGSGMPIFDEVQKVQNFVLSGCKNFNCGIVVLQYDKVFT